MNHRAHTAMRIWIECLSVLIVIILSVSSVGAGDPPDWGDAPDPTYPTLAASNGAFHNSIVLGVRLGATRDFEADGQPNASATGDGSDEDGVIFTSPIEPNTTASVDVEASVGAFLDAWIDFNVDGDWADVGEQIFTSEAVVAGTNSLSFAVPVSATLGTTFARFRLSSAGGAELRWRRRGRRGGRLRGLHGPGRVDRFLSGLRAHSPNSV